MTKRLLILGGLALCFSGGCSSTAPVPTATSSPAAPLHASFIPVENPVRELCTDDTLSQTEWFNHPVVRFSGTAIDLNARAVTTKELHDWASKYFERKAERALWVQIAEGHVGDAEQALEPLVRMYPDLHVRQIEFDFSCPKIR